MSSGDTVLPGDGGPGHPSEVGRRDFLVGLGAVAVAPGIGSRRTPQGLAAPPVRTVFRHGVASGDPTAEEVVLWTRVSHDGEGDVPVEWVVAADPGLARPVASGTAQARAERDHTVHVLVEGLEPATTYHFGFQANGETSPVGRTRTAPAGTVEQARFGVCSCARYSDGYYTAYAGLAAADVDLVIHLGDYIYEESGKGPRGERASTPSHAVTLTDYRARFAEARTDPDLQELHRLHPMAAIWDDHEFAGNAWRDGASGHDPAEHGSWPDRREAAARAWREWMPVRLPDLDDPLRIWRTLSYGDLVDLVLLDTRIYGRDRPVTDATLDRLDAPDRAMLGEAQEAWLSRQVGQPGSRWLLLGNQVVLTPLPLDFPDGLPDGVAEDAGLVSSDGMVINADQWDGYPEARRRLIETLAARPGGGVVVLTGDIHSSFALEVPGPDGEPAVTEVVVPSVTSGSLAQQLGPVVETLFEELTGNGRAVRWSDVLQHGFVVVEATPARLAVEWWHVDGIDRREGTWAFAAGWERSPDIARFSRMDGPTPLSADGLAGRAPAPVDRKDWYDPLLSPPAGLGVVATGVAGLVLLRRRAGHRSSLEDSDEHGSDEQG